MPEANPYIVTMGGEYGRMWFVNCTIPTSMLMRHLHERMIDQFLMFLSLRSLQVC